MKSQLILILTTLAMIVVVDSAKASTRPAKMYDIKDVTEVVIKGGSRLELVQSDTESLRAEADSDVIDRVVVDLTGNKLTLSVRGNSSNFFHWFDHNDDNAVFKLRLKNLQFLGVTGSSQAILGNWVSKNLDVRASGAASVTFAKLTLGDFYLELSGASKADVQQIKSTDMKCELSGATNMVVKGDSQAGSLNVGASGASNFKGALLRAEKADVGASGASTIELHAISFLKANASGGSNIRYSGQPSLQSNASGASHVSVRND